jgi:glycosyltransferase involved in cell wall biosynthesis
VLEALLELFPRADLFTLVCDREHLPLVYDQDRMRTSFLQHLPGATRWYPYYLPFVPLATKRLDLSGYKLVISSAAATLKGVRTDPDAVHICYCHTPMRYVWSGYEAYRGAAGTIGRLLFPSLAAWLRRWDFEVAQRVTYFVANSENVAKRIREYYRRESTVIYPPAETEYLVPAPSGATSSKYFLVVSQLVRYKRVDVAIDAFNRCGQPLVVIGEGKERRELQRRARPNIIFLGSQPDSGVRQAMQSCRALIFAGEEDFGIVMAEAQACGRPVIAFGRGGAREIVADGLTGLLFEEQSAESLLKALTQFENLSFDPQIIRDSSQKFRRARFLEEFAPFVETAIEPSRLPRPGQVEKPKLQESVLI